MICTLVSRCPVQRAPFPKAGPRILGGTESPRPTPVSGQLDIQGSRSCALRPNRPGPVCRGPWVTAVTHRRPLNHSQRPGRRPSQAETRTGLPRVPARLGQKQESGDSTGQGTLLTAQPPEERAVVTSRSVAGPDSERLSPLPAVAQLETACPGLTPSSGLTRQGAAPDLRHHSILSSLWVGVCEAQVSGGYKPLPLRGTRREDRAWKRVEHAPLLGHAGPVLTPREAKSPRQDTSLRPGSSTNGGSGFQPPKETCIQQAQKPASVQTPPEAYQDNWPLGQGAKSGWGQVFQNAGRGSGADTALQAPSRSVPAQRVALPFQVTPRLVFLPCGGGRRAGGALLVEGVNPRVDPWAQAHLGRGEGASRQPPGVAGDNRARHRAAFLGGAGWAGGHLLGPLRGK